MSVTPIAARCTHCGRDFHLFELLDRRTGTCPRCNTALSPDWTQKLLDDARQADLAMRHLVNALRGLHSLPGNMAVRPSSVMRNLFEEAGWERDLDEHPDLARDELPKLQHLLADWERFDAGTAGTAPKRGRLRRVVDLALGRDRTAPAAA